MELRQEHQQQQRQRPRQRGQVTMQARQTEVDKIVEQQQQTAIILERVLGRLDTLERWQQTEDRAKEREEERRDDRDDKAPESRRADLALLISAIGFAIVVLSYVAPHWKP